MLRAIRVHQHGPPEVMQWEEVPLEEPGPGQARVHHTVVGLNYIDTYQRSGLYPQKLPTGLGTEAAGVVEALGPDVDYLSVGQRVGYASGPPGAYAEGRVLPADRLIPLPDDIEDRVAAASLLKGMTAEYLLRRTFPVQPGQTILFHAAAGGVGLIACQWAAHLGVRVLGTVGSEAKAELARAHGCQHPIIYTREDFVARTRELTNNQGVPVVYDSVGKDTFERSLECLAPLGMLVLFGQSSGPVPPFDPGRLVRGGSLYLTRPTLFDYTRSRQQLLATAEALFDVVRRGAVHIRIAQEYPLSDVVRAHRDLEARRTTGSTVLRVE